MISSINVGKPSYPHGKEWNWTPILDYTQKSTQNKDLHLRPEIVKYLKENIGGKLFDLSLSNEFLDLTLSEDSKNKNRQARLHQTKNFWTARGNMNKMERQSNEWKNIFSNHISDSS